MLHFSTEFTFVFHLNYVHPKKILLLFYKFKMSFLRRIRLREL